MQQYLSLMREVRENGVRKEDRTGTGTLSLFGHQMRFDLSEGFPVITTKKLHLRSIIHELLWFLKGDSNIEYLKETRGPTTRANWARFTACNGAAGQRRTAEVSIKYRRSCSSCARIRTRGALF